MCADEDVGTTSTMQHQGEVSNGASGPQLNGSTDNGTTAVNGVGEKKATKLDAVNREMVRLIGQHLSNLGFQ